MATKFGTLKRLSKFTFTKNGVKYLGLLLLTVLVSACASEAEKEQRRDNAFDISGSYKTSASSEINMGFEIQNESGRHDIVVRVERLSPISQNEKALLEANGIGVNQVESFFGRNMVLGRGKQSIDLSGGENISDNLGETSRFLVCSDRYQSQVADKKVSVTYCLSGTVAKREKRMTGEFTLRLTNERKSKRLNQETKKEEDIIVVESHSTKLNYQVDMQRAWYRQYLGRWQGQVELLPGVSLDVNALNILLLSTTGDTFQALPGERRLTFGNEIFSYTVEGSTGALENLKSMEFPPVQMSFKSPSGRRLVFVGQISNLGNLIGTYVLVDGTKTVDLATVRFKKI